MSDSNSNSSSTGSSGSSTNSWTLLSPEEAAVENVGPVDDGTESLGDVPSLSEEVAAAVELRPGDIPPETVLSEEGHQVCQETSPESSEGPVPSSPTRLSPPPPPLSPLDPADVDLESQPPIIHDIVASSPSDNEPLSAIPFVTNMDFMAPLELPAARPPPPEPEEPSSAPPLTEVPISAELVPDTPADIGLSPASPADESPVLTAGPKVSVLTETLTATDPPSHAEDDTSLMKDGAEPPGLVPESSIDDAQETVGSTESAEQSTVEKEEMEPAETGTQDVIEQEEEEEEPSGGFSGGSSSSHDDDGLRRRNVPSFEVPRPRTSDEEEEEEEMEFKLAERTEEKPWFSLNKCIVGVVVLLFLGSLFLSGDFDASELSDGEQSQDWLNSDPQDMKELLDKLTQENQQISQLEAQLQSQKQELESALKAAAGSGDEKEKADLEKENVKLREELSSLPELKKELESLRARVTELSQLTAGQETPSAISSSATQPDKDGGSNQNSAGPDRRKSKKDGDKLKEELQRQKVLLDESRTRLQGMKKDGGDRRRVTDSLEEIQKKLSEQVEKWGKRKPQESKWKGNKDKNNGRDQWRKDEKKERRAEKPSKEGGWRDREERKEKEWKSQKPNPHKESWRKHQDEWERKKDERRMDREERRKEKPWHSRPAKSSHSQQHHQSRKPPQQHADFWKDQEQKIRRNIRARPDCSSVEDCASQEGLYPVELSEFEELLEGYLSKLEGSSHESKDKIRKLTAGFFQSGVFIHQTLLFSDFAEDVADILEDLVDVLHDSGQKGDESLEEEMEEFEREALWKFAATF